MSLPLSIAVIAELSSPRAGGDEPKTSHYNLPQFM